MAKLNGAKRVIGDELDDGEFLWQDCFFPVFVPWHSFASLWWQWCMPSKASHWTSALLWLPGGIASRRSKKIGNAYNAVFSRSFGDVGSCQPAGRTPLFGGCSWSPSYQRSSKKLCHGCSREQPELSMKECWRWLITILNEKKIRGKWREVWDCFTSQLEWSQ